MHPLTNYFKAKGFAGTDAEEMVSAFHPKSYPKGTYFVEEGKTSRYLAFIAQGLFQYFYLKDGKEITTYITGSGTFLASLSSFYRQKPSKEFVRALADSETWVINFEDLNRLKKNSEAFRSFYIEALEGVVVGIDESRSNLITLNAEERYELLLKEEPILLQQIPLQYLASILGVTPRHLSRIRGGKFQK